MLSAVMNGIVLFVTGVLGCVILVMWFGTDHQACRDNFNLMWALPTNLLIVIGNPRGKQRYVVAAIGLLILCIIVHIAGAQRLLLPEVLPLLAALFYIYGTIFYRASKK
ncbi:MAG: hypothetical protein EBZ77_16180 [Chitinophagia bacterium]|nr:hypothetical protein [Chitinophagia bacterium]